MHGPRRESGSGPVLGTHSLLDNVTLLRRTLVRRRIAHGGGRVSTPHLRFRHGHDPFWDLDGTSARRRRRLKMVLDVVILAISIAALALVFGTRPVVGF